MKRLALAVAVVALVACKKGEEAAPAADTTATMQPAGMDTMKMMGDTAMMGDTSKMMMDESKKMN
jgi:hypothetical protein